MRESLINRIIEFLRRHLLQKRWRRVATCMAAVVVFCTTYLLMLPAISMTKSAVSLSAEKLSAWSGDPLSVRVSAHTEEDEDRKIFVLVSKGAGAELSGSYVFDEDGVCVITDEEGRKIELHRVFREKKKTSEEEDITADYWFSLEGGEQTAFTLQLSDEVDEERFLLAAEAVKSAAEQADAAADQGAEATATGSDADRKAEKQQEREQEKATGSDGQRAASAPLRAASVSDALKVEETDEEDGLAQLSDGEIVNDLPADEADETGEPTETVAFLEFSAGSGKVLSEAVKDAEKNADKRGDGRLKFTWKGIAESVFITPEMVWSGDGAHVAVIFDGDAMLPADAVLSVEEIEPGTDEYEAYLAQAVSVVRASGSDATKEMGVDYARFFDICILDGDGNELEPAAPVKVVITYDEAVSVEDGGDLNVMHFHEENTPEVLETEKNGILRDIPEERDGGSSAGAGLDVDALSFTAERFSVFGIVRTSIEKLILASDGQTYRVSVSCGTGAGVPAGAELSVSEITEDSSDYAEYVSKAESALGLEEGSASSVRLFDIKILSPDGEKVEISAPVDVEIRLADMEKGSGSRAADGTPGESTRVLHFADGAEQPDVLPDVAIADDEAAENSRVLSFAAEGFSVYAIVDAPEAFIPRKVSTLEELAAQMAEDAAAETETPFFFSYGTAPMYFTNSLNGNSSFIENAAVTEASAWYFEPVDGVENGYRIYTYVGASDAEEKKYIVNTSGNLAGLSGSSGTVFVLSRPAAGLFLFKMQNANKWLQHSGSGGGIRFWTDANNNVNSRITISYADSAIIPDDYYGLDGKTVGITYDSESIFCTALMSASPAAGSLAGQDMAKMDTKGYSDRLFVPLDSDLTEWTFHNVEGDKYYITTKVDGVDQYLTIRNGSAALSSTPQEGSLIQVSPGTGTYEGFYSFSSGGNRLTVNGEEGSRTFTGVSGGSTKSSWMKLAERSNLSEDDYLIYTAQKVGVAAPVTQVVLYTRIWNGSKYEFYVVDYDGTLIRCYDDGDVVKWVGNQYVTTVWELEEHTRKDDQGNEVPNGYYELKNTYSNKYIKPQLENFSLFSNGDAYLSLDGRYFQEDYTKIKCWDDTYYSYMGLKADLESGKVVPCPSAQADDFYFAVVKNSSVHLTEVETVVNDEYGITMKMVDFNNKIVSDRDEKQTEYFERDSNRAGLLTTDIKGDGYPVVNHNGASLGTLFAGDPNSTDPRTKLHPVDRLFIQSVYDESGYFEYDSTQNFAHLIGDRFEVFDQLATIERPGNVKTSMHGQFMPFNSLIDPATNEPWPYSEMYRNTMDLHEIPLSEDDPRYGEGLHEIPKSAADYFFGMEMSANFTQTKNGLDAWGHDIIFEFSGDDDFWLYVDNELVLDLGGVHKAMSGSVNFRTGVVTGRGGTTYTLRQVFESNFRARNPEASQADVDDFLNQYFEAGSTVFRDLSTHRMKVYYMERGAGASNLHMRFNLTAVKPGEVTLSKKVTGSEDIDYDLMEFPYQILYQTREDVEHDIWNRLVQNQSEPAVTYQGSKRPVKFASSFTPVDSTEAYPDVFFLKAGEIASIDMPGDAVNYKIVECGVNMHIFQTVKANDETLSQEGDNGRKSYETSSATIEERPEVGFENIVDPDDLQDPVG